MAERFEVGEVAIAARPATGFEVSIYSGQEVLVIEGLRPRLMAFDFKEHDAYIVQTADGNHYQALPEWLRKRPPKQEPKQELGEWELCPWNPYRQPVTVKASHSHE